MGLRRSLGGVAASLMEAAHTRLELLAVEAAEEKSRFVGLLGLVAAAVLFLTLALLVLTASVALAVWPTEHRYLGLACLTIVYALIGFFLLCKVRRALREQPIPFAATLEVLERDVAALEGAGAERGGSTPQG
jgi:uncharacterized membrane protein YqjE